MRLLHYILMSLTLIAVHCLSQGNECPVVDAVQNWQCEQHEDRYACGDVDKTTCEDEFGQTSLPFAILIDSDNFSRVLSSRSERGEDWYVEVARFFRSDSSCTTGTNTYKLPEEKNPHGFGAPCDYYVFALRHLRC